MQGRLATLGTFILLCTCVLQASVARPAPPHSASASVQRGKQIAELICAPCHVVVRDQEFPPFLKIQTPSFFDIAARPGIDARTLRHFISTTHWDERTIPMTMPGQQLTPEQLSAVVSYILSLRPEGQAH